MQEFFVGGKYPTRSEFRQVAYGLSAGEGNLRDLALRAETSQQKARVVLTVMKERGYVEELPGTIFRLISEPDDDTLGRAAEEYRKRREGDRNKLEAMLRYARSTRCRSQILLDYFGEAGSPLCGRCDNCQRFGARAAEEHVLDLESPIGETSEDEDDREPPPPAAIEVADMPLPARKDTTHLF